MCVEQSYQAGILSQMVWQGLSIWGKRMSQLQSPISYYPPAYLRSRLPLILIRLLCPDAAGTSLFSPNCLLCSNAAGTSPPSSFSLNCLLCLDAAGTFSFSPNCLLCSNAAGTSPLSSFSSSGASSPSSFSSKSYSMNTMFSKHNFEHYTMHVKTNWKNLHTVL